MAVGVFVTKVPEYSASATAQRYAIILANAESSRVRAAVQLNRTTMRLLRPPHESTKPALHCLGSLFVLNSQSSCRATSMQSRRYVSRSGMYEQPEIFRAGVAPPNGCFKAPTRVCVQQVIGISACR